MTGYNDDVRSGEQIAGLQDTVLDLLPKNRQAPGTDPTPPDTCASCGDTQAIQWLKMVTDWEDVICGELGIECPDGVCQVPLCNRCRAWAEIIEIAEMTLSKLPASERKRILYERDRFLETLDPNLIRGIRMSAELSSYSD